MTAASTHVWGSAHRGDPPAGADVLWNTLLPAPGEQLEHTADCRGCRRRGTGRVAGRVGRRLVFRCTRCEARFFRSAGARP
jgi:hypothetical protein